MLLAIGNPVVTGKYTEEAGQRREVNVPSPTDSIDNPVGVLRMGETVFLLPRQSSGCG
jgi:hypothetical protein